MIYEQNTRIKNENSVKAESFILFDFTKLMDTFRDYADISVNKIF